MSLLITNLNSSQFQPIIVNFVGKKGIISQYNKYNNKRYTSLNLPKIPLVLTNSQPLTYSTKNEIKENIGQISSYTHPDIIKTTEITPGVSSLQYEFRRAKLIEEIPNHSIVIVGGYGLRYMSKGIFYKFHQNTDLLYLTGFNQPDSAVILEKDTSLPRKYKMTLFCLPKNKDLEKWDGPRCGLENAIKYFKADEAYSIKQFNKKLQGIIDQSIKKLNRFPNVFTNTFIKVNVIDDSNDNDNNTTSSTTTTKNKIIDSFSYSTSAKTMSIGNTDPGESDQLATLSAYLRHLKIRVPKSKWPKESSTYSRNPDIIKSVIPIINNFRVIKSPFEIDLLKKVGDITGEAFIETYKGTKPGLSENHLETIFEYNIKFRDAQYLSYIPVVASGKNSLFMHYVDNNAKLKDGDLILMDAGAELYHYVSDVTRTWPVNGKFSKPQKELYQLLLNIQKKCINMCTVKSGKTLNQIHQRFIDILAKELSKVFNRQLSWMEANDICPHHISHYMGMDVHDTEDVSRSLPLKKGMVVTIEPGLYIPYDDRYPKEYQGIGIRIEDDIVVTDKNPINLTISVPKEIDEIEAIMAGQK
ncbi:Creatinase/aminopeptidase [Anaeromyces robustus]|uniref:Creatinase/aminopeptidase n=1 Tax=Anaeromyces robustus TaxID=1754192 RepID=A0A1Y1W3G2_9FUNG|nr:Creatinase/aminopeptidase [Anaeromyces robustus]|eukprot:ORX68083.1 Creatinase/aminopeptidase [Anaeromyces robustus]